MAIMNVLLGGAEDFPTNKHISTTFTEDLNDTFDAAAQKIYGAEPFYTNSDLYTVYDDFETELDTTTLWTDDSSGGGAVAWSDSDDAGGVAGEAKLTAVITNATDTKLGRLTSNTMTSNRHIWARVYSVDNTTDSDEGTVETRVAIGNSTDGYTEITLLEASVESGTPEAWSTVLVVAKGSNEYDLYAGGKTSTGISLPNGIDIRFTAYATTPGSTYSASAEMKVDDVRYSKYNVS